MCAKHQDHGPDANRGAGSASRDQPGDAFLLRSIIGGDSAALTKLMGRYDRLVRYTVFRASRDRCRRDPQWLDTLSSDTWNGLVRAIQARPDNLPDSVPAFLCRIARNQVVSAMRGRPAPVVSIDSDDARELESVASEADDPSELMGRIEELAALKECMAGLEQQDALICSQIVAITQRHWNEAAEVLGLPEATIRSRWKRIQETLKVCVEHKTGKNVAPAASGRDN